MRLTHVDPQNLIGRTIVDHLNHWWEVTSVKEGHLLLKRTWNNETGMLRIEMLPRCRIYPTHEEVEARYPKLIRGLRTAALLTIGEAVAAVHGYLVQGPFHVGSEAVAHIGGAAAAIRHAWRHRKAVREEHKRYAASC